VYIFEDKEEVCLEAAIL